MMFLKMPYNGWLYGYVILKTFYNMEQKQIEGKIFDLQDKLEICEIALNEVNDCDELEPAYKDIIKAYREHISDLEEFLKLLPIQNVSNSVCPICGKRFEKGKGHGDYCSYDCWDTD